MSRLHMIAGERFGRLVLLSKITKIKPYSYDWLCQCDCGKKTTVKQVNLRTGNTSSCGCLRIEQLRKVILIHGKTKMQIFKIWSNMIQRCTNPNSTGWKNYGGRGIKVCAMWYSFINFYRDMGDPPLGLTLERKNNNGDYNPENCIWASIKKQSLNKRNNRLITFNGITQSLIQWSEQTQIPYWTLHVRFRRNWSIEKALTQKVRQ